MAFFRKWSITAQVRWALGALALLTTLGSLGMLLLARRASEDAAQVYRDRLQPMQQLMEVSESYTVNITFALRSVRGGRMAPEEGLRILEASQARAKRAWADYKAHRPDTAEVRDAETSLLRLQQLSPELAALLPKGITRELGSFGDARWLPEVVALSRHLQALREEEDRQAQALIHNLESRSRQTLALGLALMAAVLALTLSFGHAFSIHLRKGVRSLVEHLRRVADGNLEPAPVEAEAGELAMAEGELNRTVTRIHSLLSDLQSQQARERAILDGAPAAIIGLDLNGVVSLFSHGAERMLGYQAEEMIGKATPPMWRLPEELQSLARDVSDRVGHEVAPGIEALQAAATIPGFATECHYVAKDGSHVPVLLTISQVRGPDGQLLGSMGMALDLRDIQHLRDELQVVEARYRLLAERLPDVVYQTQIWPDGRRSWPFVSQQFQDFYGIDAGVLETDPSYSTRKIHPDDLAGYLRCQQEATRNMIPMEWEGRSFTERPGEMKWVRVRRKPALQADGSVLWDGVLEDITKLKQSEEALRLSEARAQEASRAKSAFLASMSHELRTPLTAILGYSRLMSRDPGRSESDQVQLEQVLRAGEHLLSLINDVLSLSKIEAGRMELKPCVFSPAELVRELESLFRLSALSKGLRFEVSATGLPAQVEGDQAKIRQVLVNLLGNALKFTAHGTVRLIVSWRQGRGLFRVEDTGPGIAIEDQAQLFTAFQQTALGHNAGGTGLGLHISQVLVSLLGGTLQLDSRSGEGTSFYFEIPLAEPEHPVSLPDQGRVVRLAEGEPVRSVLIVDDRAENRDILDRLLSVVGFQCSLAEHGAAGLEQWRQGHPDLIIMDLRMPVMSGFEAIERLRKLEVDLGRSRTPVLAVSASVYDVNGEDLARQGFDAFITKPIHEEQLFSNIEKLLGLRFERRTARQAAISGNASLDVLARQEPGWRARFFNEVACGDLEAAETLLAELADRELAEAARGALRAYNLEDLLKPLR